MTTEGSSFYSAEWVDKKRKGGDEDNKPPKVPKPTPKPKNETNKPKPPKGKVIEESDEDSKSE